MRPAYRLLIALIAAASVAATAHALWSGLGPAGGPSRVAAQLAFLDGAVAGGAGAAAQQQFPEGEFFLTTLPALAGGYQALREGTDQAERAAALARLDRAVAVIESDTVARRFGQPERLRSGAFYQGWRLLLLDARAELSADPGHREGAVILAQQILYAVDNSASGLADSYPGRYWPCDNVVAMAAVQRVTRFAPVPGLAEAKGRWLAKIERLRDPRTGLLPHEVDDQGRTISGPRGSSQALIQAFWPELSADAGADWLAFRRAFVTRQAGLVGVLEYPAGTTGTADVDSGPLVFGVSASASAVALAAARANGDLALADTLDREAELIGIPVQWGGSRRYAAGLVPIGDAFLAWARSFPPATETPSTATPSSATAGDDSPAPRALWWLWTLGAAAPGLVLLGWWASRRRRGLRPPADAATTIVGPTDAAAPDTSPEGP